MKNETLYKEKKQNQHPSQHPYRTKKWHKKERTKRTKPNPFHKANHRNDSVAHKSSPPHKRWNMVPLQCA